MASPIRGKVRRGVTGTAVAALAMAALTASQAPGFVQAARSAPPTTADRSDPPEPPPSADGGSPYHTELPPLDSPDPPEERKRERGPERKQPGGVEAGIPATVLAAYRQAESTLAEEQPHCGLQWELLAAIGKVESGQARGGAVDADGTTLKPILGPVLNGDGFAHITDTDGGVHDGDATYDRAVGPMQFIPSTWARWGTDGNDDGERDPNNIFDAALAAARYLCAHGRDLSVQADLEQAILSYNYSRDYLRTVLSWLEFYRKGAHQVPDGDGPLPDSPGAGNPDRPAQPDGDRRPGGTDDRPSRPQPTASHDGTVGPPDDSGSPTSSPTTSPTSSPTTAPTASPTGTGCPTGWPIEWPIEWPTASPSASPTETPTASPTGSPTESPTASPTASPTESPTASPTASPTESPTASPTGSPTATPTGSPTASPTESETGTPTEDPDDPESPDDPCGSPGEQGPDGDEEDVIPAPSPFASRWVSGRLG